MTNIAAQGNTYHSGAYKNLRKELQHDYEDWEKFVEFDELDTSTGLHSLDARRITLSTAEDVTLTGALKTPTTQLRIIGTATVPRPPESKSGIPDDAAADYIHTRFNASHDEIAQEEIDKRDAKTTLRLKRIAAVATPLGILMGVAGTILQTRGY